MTQELRRSLGWPALATYGLGSILGAGIYTVIGASAARAGDAMYLSFAASAVVALFTALSYAELATMFPRAGAEFLYVRRALPRHAAVAFTVGALMIAAAAATATTTAISFGGYLSAFVAVPVIAVAALLVLVLAAIAIAGIKESVGFTIVFTAIEILGLVCVIVLGATSERLGTAFATAPTFAVLPGAALVFFSYLGFEAIANLAEETRRPERTLPRALLLSLAVATVLYVLTAIAAVALLPASSLATSDAPIADAVRARSPRLAGALGGVALFATANTALAALISGSRMLYAMSSARELPPVLSAVLPRRRTPWVATLLVAAFALALLPLGGVSVVASLSSFAALLAFGAVSGALILLRYRAPDAPRPFRVPLALGRLPVLPLASVVLALLFVTQLELRAIACGVAIIIAAWIAYAILHRGR